MTLRKITFTTPGLALVPLLPSLVFRGVILIFAGPPTDSDFSIYQIISEQLHPYDWRLVGAIWFVFGITQLFRAWPPSTPAYADWLATAPWSPGKPLPKGNLAPPPWLWIAVVISSIAGALAFDISPLIAPLGFAIGWVTVALAITVRHLTTGRPEAEPTRWRSAYLPLAMIIAALFSPQPLEWTAIAIAASMLILHRQLVRLLFAWSDPSNPEPDAKLPACHHNAWLCPAPPLLAIEKLGLRPRLAFVVFYGVVLALVGSLEFSMEQSLEFSGSFFPLLVFVAAVSSVTANRLVLAPPINCWKRLCSGRFIIPAYDRMMAPAWACIAILAIAYLGLDRLPETPVRVAVLAVSTSLAFAILLCTGPDRVKWAMTAPGKMPSPAKSSSAKRNQLHGTYFRI